MSIQTMPIQTNLPELDTDRALALMDEAIAEKGEDFVYREDPNRQCVYIEGDKPACLVGQVLVKHGVPTNLFTEEFINTLRILSINFDCIDDRTSLVLARAQEAQDDYQTWGYAREKAREQADRDKLKKAQV